MHASEIVNTLIATRHADDLCVAECKTGPTVGTRHRRFDLWAIKKTWVKPRTFGYEVKVSKADYNSDDKWHDYLDYCNEFYFVTPWNLVRPEEVPGNAGLIWVTANARRSVMKKKAAYRDIEPPIQLLFYILFSRVSVSAKENLSGQDVMSYWRYVLAEKDENKTLGHAVSRKIKAALNQKVNSVRGENEVLKRENESLRVVREFLLNKLGIKESELQYAYKEALCRKAQAAFEVNTAVKNMKVLRDAANLARELKDAADALTHSIQQIEQSVKETDAVSNTNP